MAIPAEQCGYTVSSAPVVLPSLSDGMMSGEYSSVSMRSKAGPSASSDETAQLSLPTAAGAAGPSGSFGEFQSEYTLFLSSGEEVREEGQEDERSPAGKSLDDKLAAYKARKERLRQRRQEKTSKASRQREIFNREMLRRYTEQHAIEEMWKRAQDFSSERYGSSASESSACSNASMTSGMIAHEQVASNYSGGCQFGAHCHQDSLEEDPPGVRRVWSVNATDSSPVKGSQRREEVRRTLGDVRAIISL
mmetsp:Transcript_16425/g.30975  ORF Transcript_16425/g.30975 Transcript_16425/m.30975 type:complete len:249 (-) Transcript_16425:250-996(-)